jgi:hypothetical protein
MPMATSEMKNAVPMIGCDGGRVDPDELHRDPQGRRHRRDIPENSAHSPLVTGRQNQRQAY